MSETGVVGFPIIYDGEVDSDSGGIVLTDSRAEAVLNNGSLNLILEDDTVVRDGDPGTAICACSAYADLHDAIAIKVSGGTPGKKVQIGLECILDGYLGLASGETAYVDFSASVLVQDFPDVATRELEYDFTQTFEAAEWYDTAPGAYFFSGDSPGLEVTGDSSDTARAFDYQDLGVDSYLFDKDEWIVIGVGSFLALSTGTADQVVVLPGEQLTYTLKFSIVEEP